MTDKPTIADEMLEQARAFRLTAEQARAISQSAWRRLDLQDAIGAHFTSARRASLRARGVYLIPTWVSADMGRAWDAHGAEFIALAETELARALAAQEKETA